MLRDIRAEQDGGNQQEPLQPAVALLLWGSEGRACQQGRAATAVHSEGPASPAWHTRLFVLSRDCTAAQVPGRLSSGSAYVAHLCLLHLMMV